MKDVKDEEANGAPAANVEAKEEVANSQKPRDGEPLCKLFIGGLSINTTNESLSEFYSQYGVLTDCVVMRDPQTKRSRGFGFVTFSSIEEVDRAMAARPHTIDERVVDPKRAIPRDQSGKPDANFSTKRLYVSGVREEHDEEAFTKYFSEFGAVVKVEMMVDKNTNKNRGFAFITFDDYDPVDRCALLRSHMILGFRCDVKKALSKDELAKAQQNERDRMERGMRSRGGGGGGGRGGRGGGRGGGGDRGYGGGGRQGGGGYGHGGGYGGGYQQPYGGVQGYGSAPQPYGGGYGGAPQPWAGGGYSAPYGQPAAGGYAAQPVAQPQWGAPAAAPAGPDQQWGGGGAPQQSQQWGAPSGGGPAWSGQQPQQQWGAGGQY